MVTRNTIAHFYRGVVKRLRQRFLMPSCVGSIPTALKHASIAQLAEQRPFEAWVAGSIPAARIMQIDFEQMCRDYNIPYKTEVDGWVNVNCPICRHSGARGFKGGFNTYGGYYHCWNCGGTLISNVLVELLGVRFNEIDDILQQYGGHISLRNKRNKKIVHAKEIKLPCDILDARCKRYITIRNFDPDYIEKKYNVVGSPLCGEWAGRLIIPIYFHGKVVSYQGRSLFSKNKCKELNILRYKTLSKEMSVVDPKTILYNLQHCKNETLILCEGSFDAWRIGDDCAATLGTSTTPAQKQLILKLFERVFIVFDPEKDAQIRAKKLAFELNAIGVKSVEVIDTQLGHDPGDMTESETKALRKELGV